MGFNLGTTNNTGKLNMNDFLGDGPAVQNERANGIHQGKRNAG